MSVEVSLVEHASIAVGNSGERDPVEQGKP